MSERSQADRWYSNRRWRRKAARQLLREPLCKMCLEHGVVEPATVVDHVIPHKGDPNLFWLGELQSLCKPHHDGTKQQIDKHGYSNEIGIDGWPVDPNHVVYR